MVRLGVAGDVGGVVVGVVGVGSMRWMGVLRSCFKPALIFGRLMPVSAAAIVISPEDGRHVTIAVALRLLPQGRLVFRHSALHRD
jgi:hypothetical protein